MMKIQWNCIISSLIAAIVLIGGIALISAVVPKSAATACIVGYIALLFIAADRLGQYWRDSEKNF